MGKFRDLIRSISFDSDDDSTDLENTEKGMGYGELLFDNIVGIDNDRESFGEQLGQRIADDSVGFAKEVGTGMYEGVKGFVEAPVQTTKDVVGGIYNSTKDLFTKDLDERLMEMFGVTMAEATSEQVNQAREGFFGDALETSSLIPAAGGVIQAGKVIGKALPNIEIDPNTMGMNLANVKFKSDPETVPETVPATVASQTDEALDMPPEIGPNRRVDTRLPTDVAKDDALKTGALVSDGEAMMGNNNMAENFAMMAQGYPGLKNLWSDDVAETAANITSRFKENIISLYDMSDKLGIAKESAQWYVGANRIANGLAGRFGVSDTKAAGVLAVMSPQKDWFQNVALGERLIKHHTELGPNAPWTTAMDDVTITVPPSRKKQGNTAWQDGKNGAVLDSIKGKPWGELETPMQKALWLRAYDQAHFGKAYREVSPEGDILNYAIKKDGGQTPLVHQGFGDIAKAVRILEGDGTLTAISPELGGNHKVRNFFNNILNPDSPNDVTVDTHQIAAGLMRPLGSGAVEVHHGLNGANIKGNPNRWSNSGKAETGMQGSYGLYFDATTEAALLRGVLPREMQSVSWEQLRTLFPQTLKNNKEFISSTEAIWRMVDEKAISADGARSMIIAEAEKLGAGGAPSWKTYKGNRRDVGIATAGLVGAAGLATAEEANQGFASPN
mgnify:FL=1